MIVTVTGERDWGRMPEQRAVIEHELSTLLALCKLAGTTLTVRHGCSGDVDTIANEWARGRDGVAVERFPADWNRHGDPAGPIRNRDMARADPLADLCLAFWSGKLRRGAKGRAYSGTLDMMEQALQHGIRLAVVPPPKTTKEPQNT